MTDARWGRGARDVAAALAWGAAAWLLTWVRIELPGPGAFHTDLTEIALLGSALFLRSPWLTLIVCAVQALHLVPPATVALSFQTTFVMHAVAVPCAWFAHRAIQRREPSQLVLGLAWCGFVAVYYFALLIPLLVVTGALFLPPSIAPSGGLLESYVRVAEAVPYEVLFTAGVTALTFVTKEALRRRQRAQEALRGALETQRALVVSAPIAVFTVGSDGLVSSWNPAAERLFGTPSARAVGAPAPRIVQAPRAADGESLVARVLAGRAVFGLEAEAEVVGGAAVPVSLFGAPLGSATGGAVLLVEDLREQLALRAEVQGAAAMRALGELVGGMSHELRNPLFGISATLDAFAPHLAGSPRLELMERTLRGQVAQLHALAVDLLEYGKAGVSDERVVARLELPLRHALSECAGQAAAHGRTLELAVPPDLPPLHMDTARLARAFANLIHNAITWSASGGVVRVEASAEPGGLRVEVLDRGDGFRVEDLPRTFEPFFSRRSGGTGLGLSIVRRIVEHHGGTVEALNREGGGARLIVRLPLGLAPWTNGSGSAPVRR
ncbi:MAG: PAS domain-containing protein [Deltaproteobacteria bacterium]|nr:PAS domain-containing protein [Deltaproteobacteria bacterium]